MQPPSRTTRTTNNPGAVDLPKSRKSSSKIIAEKDRKRDAAVANAKKKRERTEQVARVEREIKVAQKEGRSSGRVSKVKKTFPRSASFEERAKTVSPSDPSSSWLTSLTPLDRTRGDCADRSTDSPPGIKKKGLCHGRWQEPQWVYQGG